MGNILESNLSRSGRIQLGETEKVLVDLHIIAPNLQYARLVVGLLEKGRGFRMEFDNRSLSFAAVGARWS